MKKPKYITFALLVVALSSVCNAEPPKPPHLWTDEIFLTSIPISHLHLAKDYLYSKVKYGRLSDVYKCKVQSKGRYVHEVREDCTAGEHLGPEHTYVIEAGTRLEYAYVVQPALLTYIDSNGSRKVIGESRCALKDPSLKLCLKSKRYKNVRDGILNDDNIVLVEPNLLKTNLARQSKKPGQTARIIDFVYSRSFLKNVNIYDGTAELVR